MLTKEQLQAVINEKLDNTLYWLAKAYHHRPQDDLTEQTLLEMMANLQKMQHDVNRSLNGSPEHDHITLVQRSRKA
jgi:septum formation inhibitor-activating ATPase MinD